MSHLYLDESLDLSSVAPGTTVAISGDEARHAVTVSRVRAGERIAIGDGRGTLVHGVVASTGARELDLTVDEVFVEEGASPRITLVQALAKGDRDELAVQAATELGVDEIVPWQAARSVSRWDAAKAAKGRARWATIVREAAKQAHRAWVPEVAELTTTAELARRAAACLVLILEPTATERLSALAVDPGEERDIVLVVGPEGGIAPEELDALAAAGARGVRLGDTVLRTSTAGPAALAVVSTALGRW